MLKDTRENWLWCSVTAPSVWLRELTGKSSVKTPFEKIDGNVKDVFEQ